MDSLRSAGADGLGAIGPEAAKAVPALIGLLEDKDSRVRMQALSALQAISKKSFRAEPEKWRDWWEKEQARKAAPGEE